MVTAPDWLRSRLPSYCNHPADPDKADQELSPSFCSAPSVTFPDPVVVVRIITSYELFHTSGSRIPFV